MGPRPVLEKGCFLTRLRGLLHLCWSGSVPQCDYSTEVLAAVLPGCSRDKVPMTPSTPRLELLAPPYRVSTNPRQDEQETDGQDQEHQNDDEQWDAEAGSMPGLGIERQHAIPESHAASRRRGCEQARSWRVKSA